MVSLLEDWRKLTGSFRWQFVSAVLADRGWTKQPHRHLPMTLFAGHSSCTGSKTLVGIFLRLLVGTGGYGWTRPGYIAQRILNFFVAVFPFGVPLYYAL